MHKIIQQKQHSRKKQLLVVGVLFLVVLIAGGVAAFVYKDRLFPQATQPVAQQPISGMEAIEKAKELASGGDVGGANKTLDQAITISDSEKEKSNYYSIKASNSAANDLPAAIDSAKKAAELGKTAGLYAYVAELAERNNDKALAIEYYEMAIEASNRDDPSQSSARGAGDFQNRIDLLR